jgi:hypothetical protein
MAFNALIIVGRIDCLAYGTIFLCAMFRPKIKHDVFFLPEKPQMSAGGLCLISWPYRGKKEGAILNAH